MFKKSKISIEKLLSFVWLIKIVWILAFVTKDALLKMLSIFISYTEKKKYVFSLLQKLNILKSVQINMKFILGIIKLKPDIFFRETKKKFKY